MSSTLVRDHHGACRMVFNRANLPFVGADPSIKKGFLYKKIVTALSLRQ